MLRSAVLLLLTACADRGTFMFTDPDGTDDDTLVPDTDGGKPDVPDDKEDTDGDDDTGAEPVPGEPFPCGLDLYPPDAMLGAPSRVFLGSTRVRRTAQIGQWSWSGCEVERYFEADGTWACDVVRTAKGSGTDVLFAEPPVQLDVTLEVDAAATTCDRGVDLELKYGVEIGLPLRREVTLWRTQADVPWQRIGTFAARGTATDVRFDYGTAFTR